MITSALLFAAGLALGWRYGLPMLLFASGLVAVAYAAVCLVQSELSLLKLLILFAHLVALQGGFLSGLYLGYRADERRRRPGPASEPDHLSADPVDGPERTGRTQVAVTRAKRGGRPE